MGQYRVCLPRRTFQRPEPAEGPRLDQFAPKHAARSVNWCLQAVATREVEMAPCGRSLLFPRWSGKNQNCPTLSEYPCCQRCVSPWMFTQSWIAGLGCSLVGAEGFDTGIAKPSRRAIAGGGDGRRLAFGLGCGRWRSLRRGRRPPHEQRGHRLNRSPWRGSVSTADPASAVRWPAPPSCA